MLLAIMRASMARDAAVFYVNVERYGGGKTMVQTPSLDRL